MKSDAILERLLKLHPKAIDLVLDRVLALLDDLGGPQDKLPPVVHIAGTNGKGSTLAFLRAILEAAGYSVHAYTSPHLVNFNERIRLTGKLIDEAALAEVLDHCERVNDGRPLPISKSRRQRHFMPSQTCRRTSCFLSAGSVGSSTPQQLLIARSLQQ